MCGYIVKFKIRLYVYVKKKTGRKKHKKNKRRKNIKNNVLAYSFELYHIKNFFNFFFV